ncbi:DUF6157 family protein [Naasia sp. SYSU D00057]|uniref:DUF6157 family protein n=1 Tax=Naasia sp. SYSU D00057 TaxID=2817380 RepID=UPI001B3013AC|nr:DUF6157 family protein [Naasia sp. SYSU D00057]
MHTTNYFDTFIEVAEDCPVTEGEVPPAKAGAKTVAGMHHDLIAGHPYQFTSDEVIFEVYAERAGISPEERDAARERFFSKGQPCLRSSPLGKRYGWGTHHDADGRVAAYPLGSEEYERLKADAALTHTRAMRSKRA